MSDYEPKWKDSEQCHSGYYNDIRFGRIAFTHFFYSSSTTNCGHLISDFTKSTSVVIFKEIIIPTFAGTTTLIAIDDWIVIFQKVDTSVSFARSWIDYVNGFGANNCNFWMGLEKMYQLTRTGSYKIKLEILSDVGRIVSAEYGSFSLNSQTNLYTVHVSGYTGSDGDLMNYGSSFSGMPFSTYDADNGPCSSNCGSVCGIGWWYNHCDWDVYILSFTLNDGSLHTMKKGRMMVKHAWPNAAWNRFEMHGTIALMLRF